MDYLENKTSEDYLNEDCESFETSNFLVEDNLEDVLNEKQESERDNEYTNAPFETLIKSKKLSFKKKGKNYFDEDRVEDLIINQYKPYCAYSYNEKGKLVVDRSKVPCKIEEELIGWLILIAKAIINKYRYWRFDRYDELVSEAVKAQWIYIPKYEPSKGKAFSLFSIIVKRHLLNYTKKNLKHRLTEDIDSVFDVGEEDKEEFRIVLENVEQTFFKVINEHYTGEKRDLYIDLCSILMEFFDKNRTLTINKKKDLFSTFKEYGYKSTDYKKFISDIETYKNEMYEENL